MIKDPGIAYFDSPKGQGNKQGNTAIINKQLYFYTREVRVKNGGHV